MNASALVASLAVVAGALGGLAFYEALTRYALPKRSRPDAGDPPRSEERADARAARAGRGALVRMLSAASAALERFAPLSRADADASKRRLTEAGVRMSPETWRGLRAVCGAGCFSAAFVLCASSPVVPPVARLVAPAVFACAGAALPFLFLARQERRRKRAVEAALPDAMELLGVAIAAGSPIEQCFREVAASVDGPLSEELSIVDQEVNLLGHSREKALENLASRCGSRAMSAFVAQLTQAIGQGSSIAEGLATQAALARETAQARALERIRTMPTKLDIVLSLCFLPPTVALVVVPTVVDLLHFLNDTMG